jgi:hypothetical protein
MENTVLTDSIILRVSPEMKSSLRLLAKKDNTKLGDYIRILLSKAIEEEKPKKKK